MKSDGFNSIDFHSAKKKKKPSKFVTCNGVLIVNSYENFHLNETVFVVKRQKLMTSQLNENVWQVLQIRLQRTMFAHAHYNKCFASFNQYISFASVISTVVWEPVSNSEFFRTIHVEIMEKGQCVWCACIRIGCWCGNKCTTVQTKYCNNFSSSNWNSSEHAQKSLRLLWGGYICPFVMVFMLAWNELDLFMWIAFVRAAVR